MNLFQVVRTLEQGDVPEEYLCNLTLHVQEQLNESPRPIGSISGPIIPSHPEPIFSA